MSLMHDTGEQWEIGPGIVAGSCTFDYPVPAGVLPVDNSQYKYMVRVLNTFGDWTPFAEGFFYLYSDGECGPSNAQTLCPSIMSAPSPEQLCKNPQPSPVTVSGGTSAIDPWTWICKSTVVGGKDSPQCQASVDEVSPGLAGTELSRTICPPDTINTNASALCSRFDSRFPPVVTGSGTTGDPWTWTCSDSCNDGSGKGTLYTRTISQAINATCGSANGKNYCAVNSEPDFNDLCAINGTSSNRVNGFNEWTWNCAGQCGGSSASCRAGNSRSCGWIETN
ncbi:MAG: hypothetical protein NT093_01095 [Candidatus Moranbacteria bacterium]|nr:hypothetical protein [Candidatus Moranbacteria bacterium]